MLKQVSIIAIILLVFLSTTLYSKEPLISYHDGCELPRGFGMFDVERLELYKGPKDNYTVFVKLCTPHGDIKICPESQDITIHYNKSIEYKLSLTAECNESLNQVFFFRDIYRYKSRYYGDGVIIKVFPQIPEIIESSLMIKESNETTSLFNETISILNIVRVPYKKISWNFTDHYNITLPSYLIKYGVSEFSYHLTSVISEKLLEERKIKISDIKEDEWVTLIQDDYDGLPIDLKSIKIMKKNNTIVVKYIFHNPLPIPTELKEEIEIRALIIEPIVKNTENYTVLLLPSKTPVVRIGKTDFEGISPLFPFPLILGNEVEADIKNNTITYELRFEDKDIKDYAVTVEPSYKIHERVPNMGYILIRRNFVFNLSCDKTLEYKEEHDCHSIANTYDLGQLYYIDTVEGWVNGWPELGKICGPFFLSVSEDGKFWTFIGKFKAMCDKHTLSHFGPFEVKRKARYVRVHSLAYSIDQSKVIIKAFEVIEEEH